MTAPVAPADESMAMESRDLLCHAPEVHCCPMSHEIAQVVDEEWIRFPGGELEGKRPKAMCPACRDQLKRAATAQTATATRLLLCFQCYRAQLDRERALKAAGELDTTSSARFQFGLPFEPVNKPRLAMLKAERTTARATSQAGAGGSTRSLLQVRNSAPSAPCTACTWAFMPVTC